MPFGDKLKQYRKAKGYTQEQLAGLIGVAKTTIAGYEAGNREPDVAKIKQLSKALGVTGDELLDTGISPQKSPLISSGALQLAQDYDRLDHWGQRALRELADTELARTELAHTAQPDDNIICFALPEYGQPMSAGTGQPAGDGWGKNLLLTKQPPRGASYVARISGDSMEPTYHDGERVFIRAQVAIEPGQIGVFYMNGQQWVKELGDGVLLSHNPAYPPQPLTEDVICQGLVLGVCDESYFE